MLRIDEDANRLATVGQKTLAAESLLEREDFQRLIVGSWAEFASELGFPSLKLIAEEVRPHESCADRIDLLGFDGEAEDESKTVVIELKRDSHKLQLLQALSYAAMVSQATPEKLLEWAGSRAEEDDDLRESLEALETVAPRIVLIAEEYEPEVILTADWLHSQHGVDIQCYTLDVHREGSDRFLALRLRYPLPQLDEVYRRRAPARPRTPTVERTWEDVKQWIRYPEWGGPLIDRCAREKEGQTHRRRFASMFPTDWGSFYLTFQRKGVDIVIYGRRDGDIEHWQQAVPGADVGTWGSDSTQTQGLRFKLTSKKDADNFLAAIGQPPLEAINEPGAQRSAVAADAAQDGHDA